MGSVYLAHDRVLDRAVALKFISAERVSATARARFLREARAIARLQHPNVVSIFRVGEHEGRPFLVSEYVAGEPLDRVRRPLAWERVRQVMLGLARGLAAAHRAGIVHRDVKPANAILTDEGVKLLDFGVARMEDHLELEGEAPAAPAAAAEPSPTETLDSEGRPLPFTDARTALRTAAGQLMGTPLYLAPELWRGAAATFASDVFSLGVMAWELCVGRAPLAGVPLHELPQRCREPVPSLTALVAGIDPDFARVVERCLQVEPLARFDSAEALRVELERGAGSSLRREATELQHAPWKGWDAAHEHDAAWFFGRDEEALAVVERLLSQPAVVVVGEPGVGKTSLCRAGVLPRLERAQRALQVRSLTASSRVAGLRAALSPWAAGEGDFELGSVARALRATGRPLVLFIDELDVCCDDAEFLVMLRALLETGAVKVLATARTERLHRVPELFTTTLFWLRAPSATACRELVVAPAHLAGFSFEAEQMVDALATRAAQPGGLGVTAFVLAELWRLRDVGRRLFTTAAWDALGGVEGALVQHAERALASLPPPVAAMAGDVLSALVSPDGHCVERAVDEVVPPGHEAALAALVASRLVITRVVGERRQLTLLDECLIARWPRLQQLADADREHKHARARLERAQTEWNRLGRPDDALLSRAQLAEFDALGPLTLSPQEADWLSRSRRYRARQRRQRALLAIGVPLLALAAVGAPASRALDDARAASTLRALSTRARLDAEDAVARTRRERAAALEAFDRGEPDVGEARWKQTLESWGTARAELSRGLAVLDDELRSSPKPGETARDERAAVARLQAQLEADFGLRHDEHGEAPLELTTVPATTVSLRRWDGTRWVAHGRLGTTPLQVTLAAGSVDLVFESPAGVVHLPLLLEPGREEKHRFVMPPPAAVPDGFLFIPPGPVLFGHAGDDGLRRFFLNAEPLHRLETRGFFIARHETTFAQWLEFLQALPPAERRLRAPRVDQMLHGVALSHDGLRLTMSGLSHTLRRGAPLELSARDRRRRQRWEQLPVTGVSFDDVEAYLAWLRATKRVPGARVCSDVEWERAGRGADGRTWPHGEELAPDDANFDLTYGRVGAAFGPDEVGSHARSASPFGVEDLAGNVWEWTVSRHDASQVITRGGSWYQGAATAMLANREPSERTHRDPLLGVRVCATAEW